MNIGYEVKKLQENMENEQLVDNVIKTSNSKTIKDKDIDKDKESAEKKKQKLRASRKKKELISEQPLLQFNIDTKDKQEDERIGSKLIEDFLKIFEKASSRDVKLSSKNRKYQIIKVLKKIFEEIIIFLLICISISKMNIWSFIYMAISLRLIIAEKSMMKYYRLYCFMICSILVQSVIFVSNINKNTDPYPDEKELEKMNQIFNLPWYKKKYNLTEEYGFFYGLGVSHSQINLIWMEFIEVIIIYIYLDYFSYSIYQETNTIGRSKDKTNKINYYNLYLNKEFRDIGKKLTSHEYEKHKTCMKYNFDIDILDYDKFIYYMKHGKIKSDNNIIDKNTLLEAIPEEADDKNSIDSKKVKIEGERESEGDTNSVKTIENIGDEKNKMESPLLNILSKSKQITSHTNLMEKSKEKTKEGNKCMSLFKDFIYLSFHNVILIIIIIISMMISGFISIFYITYSLYFLITSTSIYLGSKYYYPRAIKKILRITILLDITIQILYQAPYFGTKSEILEMIGLNKILEFKKNDETGEMEVELSFEYLFLVLAKAFTYLFMSFQILVYSSQSFQEYYLSYIISKNDILRRISLMNVFKFNNERIEAMNNSINLRNDMSQSMDILKNKLELWNTNLMMAKGDIKKTMKEDIKKDKEDNEDNEENEENKENTNEIGISFINILNNLKEEKKPKKEDEEKEKEEKEKEEKEGTEEKEKEEKEKEEKEKEEKEKEEKEKKEKEEKEKKEKEEKEKKEKEEKEKLNKSKGFFSSLGLPINPIVKKEEEKDEEDDEEEKKNKPLPEKEVYDKIKDWILGGFLIKFQLMLHKYASNYTTIEKNEIDIYERDIIQGKTKITSFIENMVDMQLNTLDLSNFTSAEMKEVKTYFDGTRAKKLIELKKEREKKKVFQNAGKRLILLNKLKKKMNNDDDQFDNLDVIKKRTDTFKIKNRGVFDQVRKQKK
jgi:hypothetical protein